MTFTTSFTVASQGHQPAPSTFGDATPQELGLPYTRSQITPSYLPSSSLSASTARLTISLQNTHLGSAGPGLAIHQPFSIHPPSAGPRLSRASALQPRAPCSPPMPSATSKSSFCPSNTVQRSGLTPHHSPQLKTTKALAQQPLLPAAHTPTPPLPLATLLGSPESHLPLRGAPHQAPSHSKAQAASVPAPAKRSTTEGPTQASGECGRAPHSTGFASFEPGLPGHRPAALLCLLALPPPGTAPRANKPKQAASFLPATTLQARAEPRHPQSTLHGRGQD